MSGEFKKNFGKRAQAGESITWIVATLIIILLLFFSIFIISKLDIFKAKGKVDFNPSLSGIPEKSLYSYLLTIENSEFVYTQIEREENLSAFTGNLAVGIFKEIYETPKIYQKVWFGIVFDRFLLPAQKNDYFGDKVSTTYTGKSELYYINIGSLFEEIMFKEGKKKLELIMIEKIS